MACLALEEVLHAMARHHRVANVQAKGLIVLGVLGQARGLLCHLYIKKAEGEERPAAQTGI